MTFFLISFIFLLMISSIFFGTLNHANGIEPFTIITDDTGYWSLSIHEGFPNDKYLLLGYPSYDGGNIAPSLPAYIKVFDVDPSSPLYNKMIDKIEIGFKGLHSSHYLNGKLWVMNGRTLGVLESTHATANPYRYAEKLTLSPDNFVIIPQPVGPSLSAHTKYEMESSGNKLFIFTCKKIVIIDTNFNPPRIENTLDIDKYCGQGTGTGTWDPLKPLTYNPADNSLYFLGDRSDQFYSAASILYKIPLNNLPQYQVIEVSKVVGENEDKCLERINDKVFFDCPKAADLIYNKFDKNIYVLDGGSKAAECNGAIICNGYTHPVKCLDDGQVLVINGNSSSNEYNKIIQSIKGLKCPEEIVIDEHNQKYISNNERFGFWLNCEDPGKVTVLDSNNNIKSTIGAGRCPDHMVYDRYNGNIYVVNTGINCINGGNDAYRNPCPPGRFFYPETVTVIPTVQTKTNSLHISIIDANNEADLTNVGFNPFGTKVNAKTELQISWDPPAQGFVPSIPTGTVTYYFSKDKTDCTGNIITHKVSLNNDGTIPKSSINSLSFLGGASYKAEYSGDENYQQVISNCVSAGIALPTLNTVIRDESGRDISREGASEGKIIHDTVTITGNTGSPSDVIPQGKITYQIWNSLKCFGTLIDEETFDIDENGIIPKSSDFKVPQGLTGISYKVLYNNIVSICEPLKIKSIG